jgi:SUN domain-containing protein 1/2
MIDQALLTYSKDVIARADFALASAGGQIVPSQTTRTLILDRPRLWRSVLLGKSKVTGRNALTLLWGENSPGICWPFEGSKGQVGIAFATRVKVTDVTIDHVARELVSRTSSGSAPKDIEVVSVRRRACEPVVPVGS